MSHEQRKTIGTTHDSSKTTDQKKAADAEGDEPNRQQESHASSLRGVRKSSQTQTAAAAAANKGKTTKSSGKDRHSKVNTARGPRDRRVRLSVSTAIQFYDIQDRLGFDQPSKAIEWLLKKAKPAIDELNQLPPPQLSIGQSAAAGKRSLQLNNKEENSQSTVVQQQQHHPSTLSHDELTLHGGADWKRQDMDHQSEFNELELVRGGSSRVKARDRARERAKDSQLRAMPAADQLQQQESFTAAPLTVFEGSGGGSPVCSSFTQLLQSPFPSSLQNFIHSSSQTFLQNQLLQGLYHHHHGGQQQQQQQQVTQGYLPSPGSSTAFNSQRFGSGAHHQEQDFMMQQSHHQQAEEASGGAAQGAAATFFSDSQAAAHSKSYPGHSSFHNSNLPWTTSPSQQHQQQQQQQQQASFHNYRSSTGATTGLYNYHLAHPLSLDHPRQLQPQAAQPSFYLVPPRIIQGLDLEDELQNQQQHHHQQPKRPRQEE